VASCVLYVAVKATQETRFATPEAFPVGSLVVAALPALIAAEFEDGNEGE
jgi:hypothetical protein